MKFFVLLIAATLTRENVFAEPRIWAHSTINGEDVALILDTSATHSILFKETVDRLKLKVFPARNQGVNRPGSLTLSRTEAATLRVGTFSAKVEFASIELPPRAVPDGDGVLSWNLFKDAVLVFDGKPANLRITDAVPEEALKWQEFRRVNDDVLGFFLEGTDRSSGIVYLTSGDPSGVALNSAQWKKWISAHPTQSATVSLGYNFVQGTKVKQLNWADDLSIGRIHLTDVPVQETDLAEAAYPDAVAAMGLYALLRLDIVVDGKSNKVYVRARSDRSPSIPHNRLGAVFFPSSEASPHLQASVAPNSPAATAGIRNGDIILKVDELDVTKWKTDPNVLPLSRFWEDNPGNVHRLVLRRDDHEFETTVVLEEILAPASERGSFVFPPDP